MYVGAPFSGGYVFDPTGVTDTYADNPNVGSYYFGHAGRMWAEIGNYEFVTRDLGVLIWDDVLGEDLYQPGTTTPFEAAGYQWGGMAMVLDDESGQALDSDALVTGVPNLSDFPTFTGLVIPFPWDEPGIWGRLTSLTPEPGSLVLVAIGTALIACRRER